MRENITFRTEDLTGEDFESQYAFRIFVRDIDHYRTRSVGYGVTQIAEFASGLMQLSRLIWIARDNPTPQNIQDAAEAVYSMRLRTPGWVCGWFDAHAETLNTKITARNALDGAEREIRAICIDADLEDDEIFLEAHRLAFAEV